ncbi:MAG: reverse transcriptase/maturase family protein [Patescibacteria group bacterium]
MKIIMDYNHIISLENLYAAWMEFVCGKKYKKDVADFALHLSRNIFRLHEELKNQTYCHGEYRAFSISDPKPRSIHKATVQDRLLHHAIYRVLYPYFDTKFIYDSYSCRYLKGTHKALDRFTDFYYKVSRNNHRTCWVLKCDIKKFFASIDHSILMIIVKRHISDVSIVGLIQNIVESFQSTGQGKGLPLGNLTSQLLVNVYMNEFDQYVKHVLKAKHYIRYADDFVIMSEDKNYLLDLLPKINLFLKSKLALDLHPNKVFIKTFSSGVDFLGWVHFSDHRVLRTATKKRMIRTIKKSPSSTTLQSYIGMMNHGNAQKLKNKIVGLIPSSPSP